MKIDIDKLLEKYPLIPGMVTVPQIRIVLEKLIQVIERDVYGDIVELGCNEGKSSIIFGGLLKEIRSNKELYLYDSFEGIPEKKEPDISKTGEGKEFIKGAMAVGRDVVENKFREANLPTPKIYKRWFKDIEKEELPNLISFAFFDGDLYESILDSFDKVYSRVTEGGIIIVHDYGWPPLPGVIEACTEFLADKGVQIEVNELMCIIYKK